MRSALSLLSPRAPHATTLRRHRGVATAPVVIGLVLSLLIALARAGPSWAEPSDRTLILLGTALTVPTYALGVTLHESSHALAAKLVGADVLSLSVLPGRDPATGAFHFGLTRVRGLGGRGERLFFFLAPKITGSLLLGGFAALVLSDTWPQDRYAQLTLTVFATGSWIDFTKDVVSFSRFNDVVKVMNLLGLKTEWQRLPVRLGYAAVATTFAFAVARGYRRTFDAKETTSSQLRERWVPLLHLPF